MKRLSSMLAAVAATSLVAAPAMAAPTAQSLSVAKSVRAAAPIARGEKLGGGAGVIGLLIAAGVAAIIIVASVDGNDDADSA